MVNVPASTHELVELTVAVPRLVMRFMLGSVGLSTKPARHHHVDVTPVSENWLRQNEFHRGKHPERR